MTDDRGSRPGHNHNDDEARTPTYPIFRGVCPLGCDDAIAATHRSSIPRDRNYYSRPDITATTIRPIENSSPPSWSPLVTDIARLRALLAAADEMGEIGSEVWHEAAYAALFALPALLDELERLAEADARLVAMNDAANESEARERALREAAATFINNLNGYRNEAKAASVWGEADEVLFQGTALLRAALAEPPDAVEALYVESPGAPPEHICEECWSSPYPCRTAEGES